MNHQNANGNTALHYAMQHCTIFPVMSVNFSLRTEQMIRWKNQWGLSPYDGISAADAALLIDSREIILLLLLFFNFV